MPIVLLLQALRKSHATIIRRDTAVILHTAIAGFQCHAIQTRSS